MATSFGINIMDNADKNFQTLITLMEMTQMQANPLHGFSLHWLWLGTSPCLNVAQSLRS